MTQALRLWPLLTATHRYDKSLSTRNRDAGKIIEAPILAYLIETLHGRILVDVGCDYAKISNPKKTAYYYNPQTFQFGAPNMVEEQRLPHHFARMGLTPADIDVIFLSHLHFDHAGGLCDVCNQKNNRLEVHVQKSELAAANAGIDVAYFDDEVIARDNWKITEGEYEIAPGVRAIASPGHTAGHMSLWIELPKGAPVILAGDAADLQENITDEIAPGVCWQDNDALAIESIRKLKKIAVQESANLWPNHDMTFWRTLKQFPEFHE
jgi:N-acyl homoserine lactone hydrolase